MYNHLDVGGAPQISDVIIVAGGQIYRETKAKELLDKGYSLSNKVIISPLSQLNTNTRNPFNLNIENPENIEIEEKATSTWTNATESIKVMQKKGWKSAIVVTSDFHTRRTKLAFDRVAKGTGIKFTYVSAYPKVDCQEVKYLDYKPDISWTYAEIPKYWGFLIGLYEFVDL